MSLSTVTQVAICNSAIFKVGGDKIASIDEHTRSADILRTLFDQARDEVMQSHPWNFSIRRVTLNPDATLPDSEFNVQYVLPSDCLRVLDIPTDFVTQLSVVQGIGTMVSSGTEFQIEGQFLLCNQPDSISIRYIFRNTDPSSWSNMFAECLACRLAVDLSYPLTQRLDLKTQLQSDYKNALAMARFVDGSEGTVRKLIADDWTNARR